MESLGVEIVSFLWSMLLTDHRKTLLRGLHASLHPKTNCIARERD